MKSYRMKWWALKTKTSENDFNHLWTNNYYTLIWCVRIFLKLRLILYLYSSMALPFSYPIVYRYTQYIRESYFLVRTVCTHLLKVWYSRYLQYRLTFIVPLMHPSYLCKINYDISIFILHICNPVNHAYFNLPIYVYLVLPILACYFMYV